MEVSCVGLTWSDCPDSPIRPAGYGRIYVLGTCAIDYLKYRTPRSLFVSNVYVYGCVGRVRGVHT